MFWPYVDLVRILTWPERIVVFLTTFMIPVSIQLWQGWREIGYCPSCVNWGELVLYFSWSQVALLVIAWSTKQVRAKVDEELDGRLSELNKRIGHVSEEYQRRMAGIEGQVGDLRDWMRELHRALSDELGVDLPHLAHSVSADFAGGPAEFGVSGVVTDGVSVNRSTRLLHWLKRQPGNLRRWILKVFSDWRRY